jgi:hypothetical protein
MIKRHATREPHIASTSGSVDRARKKRRLVKDAMPADGTRAAVQTGRGFRHVRALQQLGQNTPLRVVKEGQRQITNGIPESPIA